LSGQVPEGSALTFRRLVLALAFAPVPLLPRLVAAQEPARGASGMGSLAGVVTDSARGIPLRDALVVVEGTQLRAVTGSSGRYEFPSVAAGRYVVRAGAIGYKSVRRRGVSIAAGDAHELNWALAPAPAELSTVAITASRSEELSTDAPASVSVMGGQRLVELGATRLDAALNFIPGVTLNNDNNNDVSIRGSTGVSEGIGSRVLMMVDGHPLLSADGGEIDFNALPLYDVDRVEVVKGAYSALYGSNALGGVINVITTPIADRPQTIIAAHYGQYNVPELYRFTRDALNYSGVDVLHSRQIGDLGARIAIDRQTSTGFRQDDFSTRWVLRSKITYPVRSAHPSSFYVLYTDELAGNFTGAIADAAPYVVDSAARRDQSRYRRTAVGGTIIPWATRSTQLSITPSIDHDESRNAFFSDGNRDYHRATRWGTGVQLAANAFADHTIVVGADAAHTDVVSNILGTPTLDDESLFAQDDWELTERLRASFGTRLDVHRSNGSPVESPFSPKLGFRYRLGDETSLRASIGHGYRAASAIEQFTSTFQQGVCVVPNPNIRGERAWTGEVGATSALTRWVSVDGAVFEADYTDLISPARAPSTPDTFCSRSPISFQFQNIDRARVRGADLSYHVHLPRDIVAVQLNYTYLDSRNRNDPLRDPSNAGRPLPYRSTNNLTGMLDIFGGLAGVDVRYRSRPAVVLKDPVEPRSDYTIIDARVGYRVRKTMLQLKASNLFQARYVDVLEHYYGAPRTVQLTAVESF
jgi:outer membrane receptor for ferrienterochelin and colicins